MVVLPKGNRKVVYLLPEPLWEVEWLSHNYSDEDAHPFLACERLKIRIRSESRSHRQTARRVDSDEIVYKRVCVWGQCPMSGACVGRVLGSRCKVIGPSVIPLSLSGSWCGTQNWTLDDAPLIHLQKSVSDQYLCISIQWPLQVQVHHRKSQVE